METNRFFSFRNSTIVYRVFGSGKPVILIHGFGEDGNIWNHLISQLKNKFMLVVPDLPGSGRSQILEDDDLPVTINDYAEVIAHLLKRESITSCTAIGHSMGGYITLAFAAKYPEVLKGFGLFNSTAFADTEAKKSDRLKSIEFLHKNDAAAFLNTSIPALFADKFKQGRAAEVEDLINSLSYFTGKALIQYQKAMMSRPESIELLRETTLPVLFIIGEKDPAVPLQQALAQCHIPAIANVNLLTDAGHMGMLEEKELSTEMVAAYLNTLPS